MLLGGWTLIGSLREFFFSWAIPGDLLGTLNPESFFFLFSFFLLDIATHLQ